jgi:hypothetical protein
VKYFSIDFFIRQWRIFHTSCNVHNATSLLELVVFSPHYISSSYTIMSRYLSQRNASGLKNRFGPQRFDNNEELIESVKTRLSSQAADFFDTGIQQLIPRYEKCLSSGGDYVDKSLKYVRIFLI